MTLLRLLRRVVFIASFHTAAFANQPEQIDQLELGEGKVQVEYFLAVGDGEDGHAIEAMAGISDRLAAGFELEMETSASGVSFDSLGPKLLYRFTEEGAPVNFGVQGQVGFGRGGSPKEAEVRLIAEAEDEDWWAQANGMLRRTRDEGHVSTRLAYAWALQRSLRGIGWLGIEGSGQSAQIFQPHARSNGHGHFFGPTLTFEVRPTLKHEMELGMAALWRVRGEGSRATLSLFIQLSF